jgi:2',3'-cyclic-nucleotide 2'-phosphodiesterase (5'-nucleotidase family)
VEVSRPAGGTTLIVSAGSYYRWVGRLRLLVDVEGGAVSLAGYELIDVDRRVPELPEVDAVVRALEAGIVARYGNVYRRGLALAIGTIPVAFDPDRPQRDTAVGNQWSDAYRARTGTDIAVEVRGYLDEPLPGGIVVGADIFRVNSGGLPVFDPAAGTLSIMPFRLVTFSLTGAQLVQALETTLVVAPDVFPQVSGMRFDYDSRRPAGAQVILESVRVQGRPLRPDRLYSLTTNEAVAMFLPLLGIEAADVQVTSHVAYEAARDLIRSRGVLLPWPQGRIRDLAGRGD